MRLNLVIKYAFWAGGLLPALVSGHPSVGGHNHHRHGHAHHNGLQLFSRNPASENFNFASHLNATRLSKRSSPADDHSCGPGRPCGNGACCGKTNWCGYGPKFCGDGCQSNCDAKAPCGQYAKIPGQTCPLNVCCGEWGYCGTTEDFCNANCQSNCKQPKPNAPASNTQRKVIGYYEAWAPSRPCNNMRPRDIPAGGLTHLNFAFAFVTPGTYDIALMAGVDVSALQETMKLKDDYPDLKIFIAVGGWTHNDPGPYQKVFSDMASSPANRATFIRNIIAFMRQYGLDGVDIDWEYPGANDRGGVTTDGVNFTKLLQELRAAIKLESYRYEVTFTAPTSYWYLRHFDVKASAEAADWVNLMSYDLHGLWDRDNPIGNQVLAHTNLTEIDLALDLLWRNDVDPQKIVLGLGFYGRSFTLSDPSCNKPGCTFSDAGNKGRCTGNSGTLSYQEIMDIIDATGAKPWVDSAAAVNILTFDSNQWISYDDEVTFKMKIEYANKMGLNGLMIWAVDLDDSKFSALQAISLNNVGDFSGIIARRRVGSIADGSKCHITQCHLNCLPSDTMMTVTSSDPKGFHMPGRPMGNCFWRELCCPSYAAPNPKDCYWDSSKTKFTNDCGGSCPAGYVTLATDKYGNDPDEKNACGRGVKPYCCKIDGLSNIFDVCKWTGCTEECPSGTYEVARDRGGDSKAPGYRFCGVYFFTGRNKYRKLCCSKKDYLKNCNWKGKGNDCSDNVCDLNQVTMGLDPYMYGDDKTACFWGGRQRSLCCDPPDEDNLILPVTMDKLFPSKIRPPKEALPKYNLKFFGPNNDLKDPNKSGFVFVLVASTGGGGTANFDKRSGSHIELLECPQHDPEDVEEEKSRKVRVVCTKMGPESNCEDILANGVEGTVVTMPDHCANVPLIVRARSLKPSGDQTMEPGLFKRVPSESVVMDFEYDYDLKKVKRDAGTYSVRVDFSNVPGYWDKIVKAGGEDSKKKRSSSLLTESETLKLLDKRYFSSDYSHWRKVMRDVIGGDSFSNVKDTDALKFGGPWSDAIYWDGTDHCNFKHRTNSDMGSFIVGVKGDADYKAWFGYSFVGTFDGSGGFKAEEGAGFAVSEGSLMTEFGISGNMEVNFNNIITDPDSQRLLYKKEMSPSLSLATAFGGLSMVMPYFEVKGSVFGHIAMDGRLSVGVKQKTSGKRLSFFPMEKGAVPATPFDASPAAYLGDDATINNISPTFPQNQQNGAAVNVVTTVGVRTELRRKPQANRQENTDWGQQTTINAVFVVNIGSNTVDGTQLCYSVGVNALMGTVQYAGLSSWPDISGWAKEGAYMTGSTGSMVAKDQCTLLNLSKGPLSKRASTDIARRTEVQNWKIAFDPMTLLAMDAFDHRRHFWETLPGGIAPMPSNPVTPPCDPSRPCLGNCLGPDKFPFPDKDDDETCVCQTLDQFPITQEEMDPDLTCMPIMPGADSPLSRREWFGSIRHWFETRGWIEPRGKNPRKKKEIKEYRLREGGKAYETDKYPPCGKAEDKDLVDMYFHATADDCFDWTIDRQNTRRDMLGVDKKLLPSTKGAKIAYDTEHVFEPSSLSSFFQDFITGGSFGNDVNLETGGPGAYNQHLHDADWIEKYWEEDFAGKIWAIEFKTVFGSINNLKDLCLYESYSNSRKGNMFLFEKIIADNTVKQDDDCGISDQRVKQIGMIFNYMNHAKIMPKFKRPYQAIRRVLELFDTAYNNALTQGTIPQADGRSELANMWDYFIARMLRSIAENTRRRLTAVVRIIADRIRKKAENGTKEEKEAAEEEAKKREDEMDESNSSANINTMNFDKLLTHLGLNDAKYWT